jgi:hypothetical protein
MNEQKQEESIMNECYQSLVHYHQPIALLLSSSLLSDTSQVFPSVLMPIIIEYYLSYQSIAIYLEHQLELHYYPQVHQPVLPYSLCSYT